MCVALPDMRVDHDEHIVISGRCDFQPPLGVLLALYVFEIRLVGGRRLP